MSIDLKADASRPIKSPLLVLLPMCATGVLLGLIIVPWMRRIDLSDLVLSIAAPLNSAIWIAVLWWALHHLVFQLAALFKRCPSDKDDSSGDVHFAILYLTCDDFQPDSCLSCLSQQYPANLYRVVICDDSKEPAFCEVVDQFEREHPDAIVVRRSKNEGFKAGNLNHAFATRLQSDEEWVILVDADEVLPPNYLDRLAPVVGRQPERVAFVQAGHDCDQLGESKRRNPGHSVTAFQAALGTEVRLFYERDLSLRENFGFVPCLGHGVAVKREIWKEIGGFPEVVSEDYAFALQVAENGAYGVYAEGIRSLESFPKDFGAFLVRLRKFAGGSAELFRKHGIRFLRNKRVTLVERTDCLMLLLWYILVPLIVLNGFLSAYVCHRLWILKVSALHPVLPYVFVGMFLLPMPVLLSVTRHPRIAVRYWFWSAAVYGACLPITAWHFLIHCRRDRDPAFERTPKGDDQTKISLWTYATLVLLGAVAFWLAWRWWSPFSPVLAAYGTAYVSFPLYQWLHVETPIGRAVRMLIWIPGLLLLLGLYTMWYWAKI